MATHPFFPPPSAPPPPPLEHSAGSITLGIIMAIAAAAGIGISMVTQRYALASLKPRVYLWPCGMMTKFRVWFCGLVMYGAANGMQAFSLTLGPLFLLGGIFTLLLVFNLVFARLILGEVITLAKTAGALTIVVGVVCAIVAAPSDVQTEYTPAEIKALLQRPAGTAYLFLLFSTLLATIVAMVSFERRYPTHDYLLAQQQPFAVRGGSEPTRPRPFLWNQ